MSVVGVLLIFCDGKIRWKSAPTKDEIMAEFERQKSVAEYYQYAYDRCHHYPDGFEQLDMLWHAVNNGALRWPKRYRMV